MKKKVILPILILVIVAITAYFTVGIEVYATGWALLPPILAIALALITKEVYSSLFAGVVIGGLLYSQFRFEGMMTHIFEGGVISVLSDTWNVGILVFLVFLGMMVAMINEAGGSKAFGEWAGTHIKTRAGAMFCTMLLGVLIFIDDYFNCLTVGSVMRPVTDKHKISRAKLAYLIDSTAAPVCIISPISSWAAAASGFVEGENGLALFLKSIPYNYYALFSILMMVLLIIMKTDFGPMKVHEQNALNGDLFSDHEVHEEEEEKEERKNGTVVDLVFPIFVLIVCCIIGMIYTGGFFAGVDFVTAFAECNASLGLVLGSFAAIVITMLFYVLRGKLSFQKCMEALPEGFHAMVPAMLILTLAWTLKAMTDSLGAAVFVEHIIVNYAEHLTIFLPMVIFVVAAFLAFATGTSWGTFGILIPIVVAVFQTTNYEMMIISMSACMAGAVCGDHCSPISDTTIMASAGARCQHMAHVSTQIPYAMLVAAVSVVSYLVAGFVKNPIVPFICGTLLLVGAVAIAKVAGKRTKKAC